MILVVALVSRLVLAAVFIVAAAAKLADRRGSRRAVVDFGAPARAASALAIGLPVAELTVAALLLPARTVVYGAIGALALLALFSGLIASSLARGKAPDCHCFGQLHSAPASWKTLARNGALVVLAALVLAASVAQEPASALGWVANLEAAELVALAVGAGALVLLVAAGMAVITLMRSYGSVLARLERLERALADAGLDLGADDTMPAIGLEPGVAAPSFWATSLTGETVSVETLAASGLPSLLLFTSPGCGPCRALLPTAAAWQRDHRASLNVIVVSDGERAEVEREAEEHVISHVLLDEGRRLSDAYEANGTPSAVLVMPDRTIGSWMASGSEWIERLVARAVGAEDEGGLPVGAEAPAVELTSLEGEPVALASLRGRRTLLLFWNPDCGFCRSMHEDVLAWESSANGVSPRLVVVSSGDAERTRAEGFDSLVLLDESFYAGNAFSANGTPMAVLVDADGRIASPVVAGRDDVLALASGQP